MRRPTRHKNRRARPRLDHVVTHADTQDTFQHIPCLVVAAMKVQRSDPARWPRRPARILPLRDYKVARDGTENGSRQRGSDDRGTHGKLAMSYELARLYSGLLVARD